MECSRVRATATRLPESGPWTGHRRSPARRRHPALLSATAAVAFAFLVTGVTSAHAGNWTLPEDTGTFNFDTSRKVNGNSGNPSETIGFKPTVAYGLTDRLTIGLINEYQLVKSNLETDGFMNAEFYLRGQLHDQDWYMISAQDLVRLPGLGEGAGNAASSLRVEYGRSGTLGGGTWSSSIKSGFHPSLDDLPDQVQADLMLGWRPNRDWQFMAQSLNTVGLDTAGSSVPEGVDLSRAQVSVVRYLNRSLSVQVGGWQTVAGDAEGHDSGVHAMMWLRY